MSVFTPFIKNLTHLPETKSLSLLLLLAEEANKVTFVHFQALGMQTMHHINHCWDWLGDRETPLETLLAASNDNTIELLYQKKDIEAALQVSCAVLDYMGYKSLAAVGEGGGSATDQPPMLDYVFSDIPLQDFLTPSMVHFSGL